MPVSFLYRFWKLFLAGVLLAVAGCSTTGNQFTTTDLRFLERGKTTLAEAVDLLTAEPVNIYRQADGSSMARWSRTATLATDAVYFNQELWLAFDSYGRFVRIVKSNNVPHANLYQDGRRVDVPVPAAAQFPANPRPHSAAVPSQAAAAHSAPATPATSPFSHTAVSYPIGQ